MHKVDSFAKGGIVDPSCKIAVDLEPGLIIPMDKTELKQKEYLDYMQQITITSSLDTKQIDLMDSLDIIKLINERKQI